VNDGVAMSDSVILGDIDGVRVVVADVESDPLADNEGETFGDGDEVVETVMVAIADGVTLGDNARACHCTNAPELTDSLAPMLFVWP
jgi:hypothetical protein